jgi:hypothetical protein
VQDGLWSCVKNVDNPASSNSIVLAYGDVATCTATNKPQTGSVSICKISVGAISAFDFTSNIPSHSGFAVTTETAGTSKCATFTNVAAGSYTVSESTPPTGWAFTSVTCSDPGDNGSTPGNGASQTNSASVSIDLDLDETVSCTFTNTKKARSLWRKT